MLALEKDQKNRIQSFHWNVHNLIKIIRYTLRKRIYQKVGIWLKVKTVVQEPRAWGGQSSSPGGSEDRTSFQEECTLKVSGTWTGHRKLENGQNWGHKREMERLCPGTPEQHSLFDGDGINKEAWGTGQFQHSWWLCRGAWGCQTFGVLPFFKLLHENVKCIEKLKEWYYKFLYTYH